MTTANNTNGSVTGVPITTVGAGYTSAPSVTFTGGGATTQATGVAVFNTTTGTVTAILITNGGSGYTSAPTVTLSGGGFTTAATVGTATFATSSYTGTTTVDGSLTLNVNNALPGTSGGLTLTNGTITALKGLGTICAVAPVATPPSPPQWVPGAIAARLAERRRKVGFAPSCWAILFEGRCAQYEAKSVKRG